VATINNGYIKVSKINFISKHREMLEIYKRIYNQPHETRYSNCKDDIDPDYCWFKIEPDVTNDDDFSLIDKLNLKTFSQAKSLGMQINE
jgi:hypothetical protein